MRPAIAAPPRVPTPVGPLVNGGDDTPTSRSDASSSDVVPDNFMGIADVPPHDPGSSEPWLHMQNCIAVLKQ